MFFAFSPKITVIIVLMTISNVLSRDEIMEDRSDSCSDGVTHELYMTYRAGRTDASIVLIANNNPLNCTFNFNVKFKNHIVLVIEFPDWRPGWVLCGDEMNKVNVMVSNSNPLEICSHLRKGSQNIYRTIVPTSIKVQILSKGGMDTVKIMATALRVAGTKLCGVTEIECKKSDETYCMSKILQCDTHYNCGEKDKFDEDRLICHGYQQLSWVTIIVMILTSGITLLLILATIWNLLPKKKESFIFQGKEIFMEGFDNTAKRFVVDIEMRYLDHTTTGRSLNKSDSKTSKFEDDVEGLRLRNSGQTSHEVDNNAHGSSTK